MESADKDKPYELDNEDEGSTEDFDLVTIDNQIHCYTKLPKLEKVTRQTSKLRELTNENTKQFLIDDTNIRTVADTGGSNLTRGLEMGDLHEISVEGELGEFIKILKALELFPEIQSVEFKIEEIPFIKDSRKFSFLDDGITRRKYALGKIQLLNGQHYLFIEIERESKSLAMLILHTNQDIIWHEVIEHTKKLS